MDWKLELIAIPVSDVDRAKSFYVEQVGFEAEHDHKVSEEIRFVQLTPPGSDCSIALGKGIVDTEPGSAAGLQLVVEDITAARERLLAGGVEVSEVSESRGAHSSSSATPTATAGRCSRRSTAGEDGESRLLSLIEDLPQPMIPGEARVFSTEHIHAARAWVIG